MKKNNKSLKALAPALLMLAGYVAATGATTFALFTSQDETSISVSAGRVDISASMSHKALYSPTLINMDGTIEDDTNAATEENFSNGGTATLTDSAVVINNMTPGDKITFDLKVFNSSNVSAKYRYTIEGTESSSALMSALTFTVGQHNMKSVAKYTSEWANIGAAVTAPAEVASLPVVIELPAKAGNAYQGLGATVKFSVEAVQANANVSNADAGETKIDAVAQSVAMSTATEGGYVAPATTFTVNQTEGTAVSLGEGWHTSETSDSVNAIVTVNDTKGEASGNIQIAAGEEVVGGIQVNCFVNGSVKHEFNGAVATVTKKIDAGLNNVKVSHTEDGALVELASADAEFVPTATVKAAYHYDASTGVLTIKTSHFSEFVVTAKAAVKYALDAVVDGVKGNDDGSVTGYAKNNKTGEDVPVYKTIAAAKAAGKVGIGLVDGDYMGAELASPTKIAFYGLGDAAKFNCNGSGSIASLPNGAEFNGLVMTFGKSNYHGFQHAGKIVMKNCTLNGLLFSYGDMEFDTCTFNSDGGEYCMWCYGKDVTYKNCTANIQGKFANVYNEGNDSGTPWKVVAEGCTFNSTKANKAVFNIKESCNSTALLYDVTITDCTVNDADMFPAASTDATGALYVGSPLWQVDDRKSGFTGIKVTLDGNVVYENGAPVTAAE